MSPRSLSVRERVSPGDSRGPSLFASALQQVVLAANRQARAVNLRVQIRVNIDDVFLTGSASGVEYVLQDFGQLATAINLHLNIHKCGWWPDPATTVLPQRHPLLHSVKRPERLTPLSVPFADAAFMEAELQRILTKVESLQEELVKLIT